MSSGNDDNKEYEEELERLVANQEEEMKKKTNPLFAKMHGMDEEETEELRRELEKAHEMQRNDLANKYGIKQA